MANESEVQKEINEMYCRVFERLYRGFRPVIGFIGLLQLVTTLNYSDIANSYTLQCTIVRTLSCHYKVLPSNGS
jgi:hypothetical protein